MKIEAKILNKAYVKRLVTAKNFSFRSITLMNRFLVKRYGVHCQVPQECPQKYESIQSAELDLQRNCGELVLRRNCQQ